MYFYVDESGHTGLNISDLSQPVLYYGLLSSKINLDILADPYLVKVRKSLGVTRLHASKMGNKNWLIVVKMLLQLNKKYHIRFDLYRVNKIDHAIIAFFDQVFDQGNNKAVPWSSYWTPMRYIFLLKIALLFDNELIRKAWAARIELDVNTANALLVEVCEVLRSRIDHLGDERSRQVIGDALQWVICHPSKIHYNSATNESLMQVSPNLIGFQFVMSGIASRLKNKKDAKKIVIDQQLQFNKAQKFLAEAYARLSNAGVNHRDDPLFKVDFKSMPSTPLSFTSSKCSAGLEIVDAYLWIFKRCLEGKQLAPELLYLISRQSNRTVTDEYSLKGVLDRWNNYYDSLPEPSQEDLARVKEVLLLQEELRLKAIKDAEN